MRNLLVLLVVIGHATYYDIITPFGGIQYGMLMEKAGIQDTLFHSLTSELTNFIYTFHMPVFIALSGSLFAIGKKLEASAFIIKKNEETFNSVFCGLVMLEYANKISNWLL